MRYTLGFSPCPNDCFIFDALVNGKIDLEGLEFDVVMEDVESLNTKAFQGELDISKLSYHAYMHLVDRYALLNSGSALGFGCGPLLITQAQNLKFKVEEMTVAIPGKYTTANLLFSLAYPDAKNKTEMLFSDIENAVLSGKVAAGVIIHENRFTYEQKGLVKIIDLGEYWETLTGSAIPLGGIVVNRKIEKSIQLKIDRLIRKSVEYAFANPSASREYVKKHAQEMDESVIQKHIDLYVNKYSVDLGIDGKRAVQTLFDKAIEKRIITNFNQSIFL
ncbi:MAG: 1,4-dihydroxy-6-naphthoate synthase [Bacteroidetes bacterium]|nr:1,4-dihydroxy-6-naphthoate synthase [Bacteroidota bacterium]